jgi:hypothetical protein
MGILRSSEPIQSATRSSACDDEQAAIYYACTAFPL